MTPAQQTSFAHTISLFVHLLWLLWLSRRVLALERKHYMAGYRKGLSDGFDQGLK